MNLHIKAIKERLKNCTSGPREHQNKTLLGPPIEHDGNIGSAYLGNLETKEDADFIVHARVDVECLTRIAEIALKDGPYWMQKEVAEILKIDPFIQQADINGDKNG